MAKRINISQLKSKLRQLESKQRQAIARYNQGVRKYNQEMRNLKRAIDRYNQEVRAYNSRQRLNQQRLQRELRRLQTQQPTRYSVLRTSVSHLHSVYTRMEQSAAVRSLSATDNYFLDLAEREAANSVEVVNALLAPELLEETTPLQQAAITDEIA
jgi:uncharacterized protein YukE